MMRNVCGVVFLALMVGVAGPAAIAQDHAPDSATSERLERLQRQQAELLARLEELQKEIVALRDEQNRARASARGSGALVATGAPKLKLDGLLQQWFTTASGGGVNSGFSMRRAEIKLSGEIRPDVHWFVMVDPAKTLSLTTTSVGGTAVATGVRQSSQILQDAVISYAITSGLSVDIGQQKVPLSMMALRSSAQLPTVERPLMNTLPGDRGRMGDIRDIGIQIRAKAAKAEGTLAILNDSGSSMNSSNDDNRLDTMYRLVYEGLANTHLGVAGTLLNSSTGRNKTPFKRLGFELAWTPSNHIVEAEYGLALDAPGGSAIRSRGGYICYVHRCNPSLDLVARFDQWIPDTAVSDNIERDYTLGANWYLKQHGAKLQLSLVRKVVGANAPSFLGTSRTLIMTNAQIAY